MTDGVSPIRLALIGAGLFARHAHLPTILSLGGQFEIVAVCSRRAEAAQELADLIPYPVRVYTDYEAVLAQDDISLIDLTLPINALPEGIRQALRAGKHVLSEKPLAPTVTIGRELVALADQYPQQVWMVGENWRYAPAITRAAEIVQSGRLGQLAMFNWSIFAGMNPSKIYYQTPWRRDNSYQGGFLLDGGVHFVAGLRTILGEVARVHAQTQLIRPDLPPADTMTSLLEMESGLLGTFATTYAAGTPWATYLTLVGSEGVLEVNRDGFKLTLGGQVVEEMTQGSNGLTEEFHALAAALAGHTDPRNAPRQALADLAVVEALLTSAQTGQAIHL